MGKIRGELEDLAFRHLEPEAFDDLKRTIESRRKVSDHFLAEVRTQVEAKMKETNIPARVEGRVKRLYSIWQKLRRQQIPIEQVYDLLAVRIVTDNVKNCYGALGIIHNTWRPVPGRIKDFIAIPRPNLYQSLHTSVIGPQGQPFEVQIRTEEMHRIAEEGIAAHWKYKDGHPLTQQDEERFAWLRHLVEWQQEMRDPGEFLSTLKIDLYPEEVYTFTPKGKVIVLPRDATPIDFAYAIHTEVGHHCVGAKVNGRIMPLKYHLRNGDIVEIITQASHAPSRDWLGLVNTSRARNKIKHWINVAQRKQALEIGKRLLEKEARKYDVSLKKITAEDYARVVRDYGCTLADDLYAGIGYGKYAARQVLAKLAPAAKLEPVQVSRLASSVKRALGVPSDSAIQVDGHDDLMVYRAKCCNPVRGEEILGYITRGKGIAVHAKHCSNVQNLLYDADRRIDVEWVGPKYALYPVKLALVTEDRQGMLADVTAAIAGVHSNIQNIEARTGDNRANITSPSTLWMSSTWKKSFRLCAKSKASIRSNALRSRSAALPSQISEDHLSKQAISTPLAPAAIGPYSQAIRSGNLLFLSGQIPLDPATGHIVEGDAAVQTARVLQNLSAILEAAGSSLASFESHGLSEGFGDFGMMNEVYARFFTDCPPARATVEVARLPRNVSVEIDLIAEVEG